MMSTLSVFILQIMRLMSQLHNPHLIRVDKDEEQGLLPTDSGAGPTTTCPCVTLGHRS